MDNGQLNACPEEQRVDEMFLRVIDWHPTAISGFVDGLKFAISEGSCAARLAELLEHDSLCLDSTLGGTATVAADSELSVDDVPPAVRAEIEQTLPYAHTDAWGEAGRFLGDRYLLLRYISSGGFGEVWRAYDLKFQVVRAIKLLLPGKMAATNPDTLATVLAEARASSVSHENIVQVYDAGHFEREDIYFIVMELIVGSHSTRPPTIATAAVSPKGGPAFCPRKAAIIVSKVCDGVAAAHRREPKLVHGDINPKNILLTRDEQPKLADFGLAVAELVHDPQQSPDQETSVRFRFNDHDVIGTPAYIAPERLLPGQGQPTVKADIYALGATLYFLLHGKPPFHAAGKLSPDPHLDVAAQIFQGLRPLGLSKHTRLRRSRLLAICAKAMAADPRQRYARVEDIQHDLTAWLNHRPTSIDHPLFWPALWSRRHWPVVAIIGTLTLATLFASHQALVARRAERRSTAVSGFVQETLGAAAPWVIRPDATIAEALDHSGRALATQFQGQPEVKSDVSLVIGSSYQGLGLYVKAEPFLRGSYRLRVQLYGEKDEKTIQALAMLARNRLHQEDMTEARTLTKLGYEESRSVLGPTNPNSIMLTRDYAMVIANDPSSSSLPRAQAILKELIADCEASHGANSMEVLETKADLGTLYKASNQIDLAVSTYRDLLRVARRQPGAQSPMVMAWISNLGHYLHDQGKLDEAEALLRESWELRKTYMGVDHCENITSIHGLARVLDERGRFAEAQSAWEEAVRIADKEKQNVPLGHPYREVVLDYYAKALARHGQFDRAEKLLQRDYNDLSKGLGDSNAATRHAAGRLRELYMDWRKPDLAAKWDISDKSRTTK